MADVPKSKEGEAAGAVYAMPATPLQVRLWNLNRAAGADAAWNVAVRFRLSGTLDREILERSLQMLTARHEALRTSLGMHAEAVVERISARVTLPVEWCDLRGLDGEAQAEEALRLSSAHAMQPLPLDCAPLFRVRVLRLGESEHLLLWNAHYSICDGSSVGLLAADLMVCYGELLAGREPEPRNSLEYADYAVWLDAFRRTPEYESHRNYWKRQLRAWKVPDLPPSWVNPVPGAAPAIHSTVLPRRLTDRMMAVAQAGQATFFHAVLAAFATLMRSHRQLPEVVVGTPLSGRDQTELEKIVGAFVNYVPLHFPVRGDASYTALLEAVRDSATDSFDHSQFRCEDMLAELPVTGSADVQEKRLFSVGFICQQDFVRPVEAGGVSLTAVPSVSAGALRPLTVFMVERADGWRLSCEVDNRVVSAAAGAGLLEEFERLLAVIADHPEERVTQLTMRAGLAPIAETIPAANNNSPAASTRVAEVLGGPADKKRADSGKADKGKPVRLPATEAQVRFWLLDRVDPGNATYDLKIRLELNGALDPDALRTAAEKLVERNEILRTTLEEVDDKVWQVVHPDAPLDFSFQTASASSLETLSSPAPQAPFSLGTGPLLRIQLVRIDQDRHWLTIALSHAIADGWSSGAYLEQLGKAYQECLTGVRDATREAPGQFSLYAAAERNLLAGPEKEKRLAWWEKQLEGVWTPLALPRDIARNGDGPPGTETSRAAVACSTLDSGLVLSARRFARECNATLFALFGAAFQALLARYSGQGDVLFLTPFANRTEDTETVLGPLAVPVCMAAHIAPETTFRELASRLSAQSMDATENVLPFSLVAPLLDMRVVNGKHTLNQVSFFHQRAFVHDMHWGSLEVKTLQDVPATGGSEWQLGVIERSGVITAEFLYDATAYSEGTMSLVGRHYAGLLARGIQEPDTPLSRLQIATPEEIARHSSGATVLPVTKSVLADRKIQVPSGVTAADISGPGVASTGPQPLQAMLRIWQQLFKTDGLNADSNFFDLGGHSLLLARLQILVKKTFNVQLAAADVFRCPTVAALTDWLERTQAAGVAPQPISLNPRVIPIQPLGKGRPLFVISQSMIFRTLAAELGTGQPVYALNMLDEDATSPAHPDSFDRLAAFYVRLVREIQPAGPYRLAGWCVSGWIAYEIARQLETQGEKVELLMVMDAWAPGYWRKQSRTRRLLMESIYRGLRFRWIARRLRGITVSERMAYVRASIHGMAAAVAKNSTAWLHRRLHLPLQVRLTEEMRLSEQLEYTTSRSYDGGPLRGNVLFFRSDEQPTGPMLALDMGWSKMLGRPVEVQVLPGDHREIFDLPGARMMAISAAKVLNIPLPARKDSETLPGNVQDSAKRTRSVPMVEA